MIILRGLNLCLLKIDCPKRPRPSHPSWRVGTACHGSCQKKAPTPFGAGAFAYAVRSRNCGSKRYILSGCGSQIGNDLAKTRYADSQAIGKITRQSDPIPAATYFYTIMKRVLGKRDTNLTIEQGKRSCEKEPHPDGPNYHPYQTLIHTQFLLPTVSSNIELRKHL